MPVGGTAFFGQNQHPRITTNYLNQMNRHGDPAPGVPVSTAQVSGSIVQPYSGFEGGKLTITNPWAVQFADPTVGPLYGGLYQYVQLDPTDTAPLSRGQIVFWSDELNYMITADGIDTGTGLPYKLAGVALTATWVGYWDFIQIAGIALVKFTGAGTIGQLATVNPAVTPATVTAGGTMNQNFLGMVVMAAAVANEVSPVELNILQGYNF